MQAGKLLNGWAGLLVVACLFLQYSPVISQIEAEIPYQRTSRPSNNPYCQAMFPFCPKQRSFPEMLPDDEIEVWALKAPIWEFRFGDLMGKLNGFHDAIGFYNRRTKANYTMEWYELDQLLNCTFPHIVDNGIGEAEPLWCNQGAACFYDGIDDLHWSQNGTLEMASVINGSIFNSMAEWVQNDNSTGPFYVSWGVAKEWDDSSFFHPVLMDSYDCASFVIRTFEYLHTLGAVFDSTLEPPKYDFMILYADKVEKVDYQEHKEDIVQFYSNFQAHQSVPHMIEDIYRVVVEDVLFHKKFYYYYNEQYWLLHMKHPYVKLHFSPVPYPGTR